MEAEKIISLMRDLKIRAEIALYRQKPRFLYGI
jgi:hypothetical protein